MKLDNTKAALLGKYFKVVLAETPDLMDAVYRLRYQVYCVERSFEQADQFRDNREMDEYDAHAVHAALIHRNSGSVCGCVRLVLPTGGALPIREIVQDPRALSILDSLPRRATAEVSRYAVSKCFRRRAGEGELPDLDFFDDDAIDSRRVLPHITVGLIVGVATLSLTYGISYLCAVMRPALLRLLDAFGLSFWPLGETVEYHGARQPCFAPVTDLLAGVGRKDEQWLKLITSEAGAILRSPAVFNTEGETTLARP
jgi:N-acyl amino acid synthase of PEP-CTERM/exosortase system